MKKFTITIIMIILFLISTVSFAENLPVERDSLEKYELQQVGTIMMHGGPNSGAYYKIITDNGVAELVMMERKYRDGSHLQNRVMPLWTCICLMMGWYMLADTIIKLCLKEALSGNMWIFLTM